MTLKISVERYRATNKIKQSFARRLISSRMPLPALFLVVMIMFACLYIWQRVYVMDLAKDIAKMEKQKQELTDQLRKTNADVAEFSRLSRIEPVAAEKFGLARTTSVNLFTLEVKKTSEPERAGLDNVVWSLKKLADNLPVLSESKADTLSYFKKDGN
jgi:cell division protein FtsL